MINSHYLFVIYLDYVEKTCRKRVKGKTKMIFRRQKKTQNNKIKYNKINKCTSLF